MSIPEGEAVNSLFNDHRFRSKSVESHNEMCEMKFRFEVQLNRNLHHTRFRLPSPMFVRVNNILDAKVVTKMHFTED